MTRADTSRPTTGEHDASSLAALRTELCRRPADAWFTSTEAAAYLGCTRSGLRTVCARGDLAPDGRGLKGLAMFRRRTLDAFLEARAFRGRR
jgi:hypothetical protein